MTTNERIEKLEMQIFVLECKDHWNTKDYEDYAKMNAELRELKKAV